MNARARIVKESESEGMIRKEKSRDRSIMIIEREGGITTTGKEYLAIVVIEKINLEIGYNRR